MEDEKEKDKPAEAKQEVIPREELMKDKYFGLILPENSRIIEKRKAQLEEETKKINDEKKKRLKIDSELNKRNAKLAKEEAERERKRLEAENAQLNYEKIVDDVKNGEGNLNEIFSTIIRNTSAYELAFPNFNIDENYDFSSLTTLLERNTSLLTLSLSRKNLNDDHAQKLSDMLKVNKKLRRLELEGNFFGPKAAGFFGQALKVNNTLRYLDLENNNLTDNGKDISGLKELCSGLQKNTMLISLNIANNRLNAEAGSIIIDMLRSNKNIINLEFFQNKEFSDRPNGPEKKDENSKYISEGLYIDQIEKIKENLKKNYDAYMKMRTDEWKERQRMTNNYQDNVDTQIINEAQKTLEETRKKEQEDIEALYLNKFNENIKVMEDEFTNKVNQFFAETKERMSKRKGKAKKKKK